MFLLGFLSLDAHELLKKRTQVLMGTYVSISLPHEDIDYSSLAFERLKEVEMALSSYDREAQIYRLNYEREVSISKDTLEALSLSEEYYHQTEGYFDITIGSVTKGLFHFGESERVPGRDELVKAKVDFKGLHFNDEKAWVEEGVLIDLGGMGKGFGVDKARELLEEKNISKGVIALSGDIFCFHRCEMQIQNPFAEKPFASFRMAQKNTSISTSGNYRRYVEEMKYNHLINPKTRESSKSFVSITLMSTEHSNSDLDAYATAASVMPRKKAVAFLDESNGLGYLLVTADKKVLMNDLFKLLSKALKVDAVEVPPKREYIRVVPLKPQNSKRLRP